ncbi:MAG: 50S ribosomal protein L9 [Anaerolinea sp.]|nr:50S ribosomal protein L9 [Anaerolinea sp.]
MLRVKFFTDARCTLRVNLFRKGLKMKVLLIKDVYKLGHAGDVKKVADGFGRNFLLPQGLAVLATPGALSTVERIRSKAAVMRAALNNEMSGLAEQLEGVELLFVTKAGETGKLYGSITSQMVADALNQKMGTKIERHQIESEPIRNLGEHHATVRLTIDLNPKVKVVVSREGESTLKDGGKAKAKVEKAAEPVVEALVAETVVVEDVVVEALVVEEAAAEQAPEAAAE